MNILVSYFYAYFVEADFITTLSVFISLPSHLLVNAQYAIGVYCARHHQCCFQYT